MSRMDFFPLPFSNEEQILSLDDHRIAELLRELFRYSRAYSMGEDPTVRIKDPIVRAVFLGLYGTVRDRFDEYRRRSETNSRNASGHGAPKGNRNAHKVTEEELQAARRALADGDLSAAETIVKAIHQQKNKRSPTKKTIAGETNK